MTTKKKKKSYFVKNYSLYVMLLPALGFICLFSLVPMYGLLLAFKKYDMFAGDTPFQSIFLSKWVGLKYFKAIFSKKEFLHALRNTITISLMKIGIVFPLPIIFAIILNEIKSVRYQRVVQTVVYLPHFLSWIVVSTVFVSLLGSTGTVNSLIASMGGTPVKFLMDNKWFRWVLIISDAWKEVGWGSIVYFAAIAGMDRECFEAAEVDGASRFQRIIYVEIPDLMPTIILMLILRIGSIMDAGFGQIFAMYNPTVYDCADIIGTYIYRIGLGKLDFSTGTAVGIFNSVIAFGLVLGSNFFARKATGKGMW